MFKEAPNITRIHQKSEIRESSGGSEVNITDKETETKQKQLNNHVIIKGDVEAQQKEDGSSRTEQSQMAQRPMFHWE